MAALEELRERLDEIDSQIVDLYEKRMVFNEFGHRFYLDTYGVKWLAFDDCFPSPAEKGLE